MNKSAKTEAKLIDTEIKVKYSSGKLYTFNKSAKMMAKLINEEIKWLKSNCGIEIITSLWECVCFRILPHSCESN